MQNLNDYIPDHLKEYPDIRALMNAVQPEIDAVWERLEQVWLDQYISTMSEETYLRWRKTLRLYFSSDPEWQAETDPDERERLLNLRKTFLRKLMCIRTPVYYIELQDLINAGADVTRGGSLPSGIANAKLHLPTSTTDYVHSATLRDVVFEDGNGDIQMEYSSIIERCVARLIKAMLPADRHVLHIRDVYHNGTYDSTIQKEEVLL